MKIKSIKKVTTVEEEQFYDVINAEPYNNFFISVGDKLVVSHNCNFTDKEI